MNTKKEIILSSRLFTTFVVIVIISLVALCYISNEGDVKFKLGSFEQLSDEWIYNGHESVSFPHLLTFESKNSITLECVLPTEINKNDAIFYYGNYCGQEISVDGEVVYSQSMNPSLPFGEMRGTIYVVFGLKPEYAGKTMTVKMYNPYNDTSTHFDGIMLTTEGDAKYYLFRTNVWRLLLFVAYLVGAFVMFVLGILHNRVDPNNKTGYSFNYFAFFTLSVAGWNMMDVGLTQFFTSERTVVQFFTFVCLIFIGITYSGLCASLFPKKQLIFHSIEHSGHLLLFLMIAFYVLDIVDPVTFALYIYIYAAICLLVAAVIILTLIHEYTYSKHMLVGSLGLFLGCGIAVYRYAVDPMSSNTNKIIITAFTFYNIILFAMLLFYEIDILKNSIQKNVYEKLAFTDELTGIANRACFEKVMDDIESDTTYEKVIMFMGDLNSLKEINDKQGHEAGDEYIIAAATCLQKTFENDKGAFRLGGDEFVAIVVGDDKDASSYYNNLEKNIEEYQREHDVDISIAISHAECKRTEQYKKIRKDLYREADKNMYNQKNKMK